MNILFLTLYQIDNINNRGIYEDLLREFIKNNHHVYAVSPTERRNGEKTGLKSAINCTILKVKTGNIQKTNIIEKGISTVLLERQFISAIKRYFSDVTFDLVLYSTPPITLAGVVEYIKKRDNATTYLLLKDIFPQNAVDIGMMSKTGIKGLLYKYFLRKEKKLYAMSDYIGCMSQANVDYVIKHNAQVDSGRVEICPNSIEPVDMSLTEKERIDIRDKYGIPQSKTVFVYGGNLGKPQGIPFLIDCLRSQKDNEDAFFLIVGDGTEYPKLLGFIETEKQQNVKLISRLPRSEYDKMVAACDVGMIFLDHRFTIPNFPSRLLAYMQAKLPVLAVTDANTDIGKTICEGGFGWWCESNDINGFCDLITEILKADRQIYCDRSYEYLNENFSADISYLRILEKMNT